MEEQFPLIEKMAIAIYDPTSSNEEKQKAVEALQPFHASLDYVPHCKMLLEKSNSQHALLFASSSLCESITKNWNIFSQDISASVDLRNYLLGYLWNKFSSLELIVTMALIKLLCRVTKLGWQSDERHQQLTGHVNKFFESTVEHQVIGFRIINSLITELNNRYVNHSIAVHRTISSKFRDGALLNYFDKCLEILHQVVQQNVATFNPTQNQLLEQTIDTTLNCLNFDFFGNGMFLNNEDMGIVQIPSSWKSRIVDGNILDLFFRLYSVLQPPSSAKAMEIISMLTSVRATLFDSIASRNVYLSKLISGLCLVLQNNVGLLHADNHHQLCRVLARIKSSHQLAQLMKVPDFEKWALFVCEFSCKTFQSWQWSPNSIFYLLSLWSRLVTATNNMKPDECSYITQYAVKVVQAYINSRVESVGYLMQNQDQDDPLLEDEHLQEQLETLPHIIRCSYQEMSTLILGLFDPLATEFQQLVVTPNVDTNMLALNEGKLAWLVFIIGAILGGRLHQSTSENDVIDGDLGCRVLQLQTIHDQRLVTMTKPTIHTKNLEKSFLSFVLHFRHVYIGDPSIVGSAILSRLSERLNIVGTEQVMEFVVRKIITNLNCWARSSSIIEKTLEIFDHLVNGYLSLKRLAVLNLVETMLTHHTAQHFPFLNHPDNGASRTAFYRSLSRILFLDKNIEKFDSFIAPFGQSFEVLVNQASVDALKQDQCRTLFIGLVRDLTGIFSACQNKLQYERVWDWIYPKYVAIIGQAAGLFYDTPAVTSAILKLGIQMATNSGGRLDFGCSSANGILLFREISKIVIEYGDRIAAYQPLPSNRYPSKLKGVYLVLKMIEKALSGNYVNFAIFDLYGDPALSSSLNTCVKLSLDIPTEDLKAYPKLTTSYFSFLHYLCKNHLKYVLLLDTPRFVQIVRSIQEGLNQEGTTFQQSCSMIESLCSFYYKNRTKDTELSVALNTHLRSFPELFSHFLTILFQIVLFMPNTNHWCLSGALLCLILLDVQCYNKLVEEVINSQPVDRRQELLEIFSQMMKDIDNNLQSSNKERFTRNLTTLKQKVKNILLVN